MKIDRHFDPYGGRRPGPDGDLWRAVQICVPPAVLFWVVLGAWFVWG